MCHDSSAQREKVQRSLEGTALTNRHLHGNYALTEAHTQLIDNALEIRMLAVHLIKEDCSRHLLLLCQSPYLFCFYLNTVRRRYDYESVISRQHGSPDLAEEIRISRSIEEIQLTVLPFHCRQL